MSSNNEIPGAGTTGAEQGAAAAAVAGGGGGNLSGVELAAVFAKRRKASRATPAPASEPGATTQPDPASAAAAPAGGGDGSPDETNAASTPAETGEKAGTVRAAENDAPEEPEAESGAGGEPEGGGEPEPGGEREEPEETEPRGVREMRKRIDALTARLRQAEAERDELKAKVSEPKAEPETALPAGAFAHDPELRQVSAEIEKWRRAEAWAARNPDGGEIEVDGKAVSVSAEQAEALRGEAAERLADLRALKAVRERELRKQDAEDRARSEAVLKERFPWANDPKSEGSQLMAAVAARVPGVTALPGWRLWLAYAFEGLKADQARQAAGNGKGAGGGGAAQAPAKAPPKVAVPAGAAGSRVDPLRKQLAEAEAAFEKSGSNADFARVQKLRRAVRAQAAR